MTVSFSFSVIFYEKRQLVKSCRIAIRIQANIMVQYERRLRMSKLIQRRVYKWSRLGDVPIWYFRDRAIDVRTECMYTDAKIRKCLVRMKVLGKQIRLFCYCRN